MRFLLLIPVLTLFLSNVPFVRTIPVEAAQMMIVNNECPSTNDQCRRNTENISATCSVGDTGCENSCTADGKEQEDSECSIPESDCVCICCFQYVAPLHSMVDYHFHYEISASTISSFIAGIMKDEYVGAPWQPPDLG